MDGKKRISDALGSKWSERARAAGLPSDMSRAELKGLLSAAGMVDSPGFQDGITLHLNKPEYQAIKPMLKAMGGAGVTNEVTGGKNYYDDTDGGYTDNNSYDTGENTASGGFGDFSYDAGQYTEDSITQGLDGAGIGGLGDSYYTAIAEDPTNDAALAANMAARDARGMGPAPDPHVGMQSGTNDMGSAGGLGVMQSMTDVGARNWYDQNMARIADDHKRADYVLKGVSPFMNVTPVDLLMRVGRHLDEQALLRGEDIYARDWGQEADSGDNTPQQGVGGSGSGAVAAPAITQPYVPRTGGASSAGQPDSVFGRYVPAQYASAPYQPMAQQSSGNGLLVGADLVSGPQPDSGFAPGWDYADFLDRAQREAMIKALSRKGKQDE